MTDVLYSASIQRRTDTKLKRLADFIYNEGDLKQLKESKNILIIFLYYFHLEGFLNLIGSNIWNTKEWEIMERTSTKNKLNLITDKLKVSISKEQNDAFRKMHSVRNDLVHPKPNKIEEKSGIVKDKSAENIFSYDLKEYFHEWHKYENDKIVNNIKNNIPKLCINIAKKAGIVYTCGDSMSSSLKEIK